MTNLQDKPIIIGQPVEIELAVNEVRKVLSTLTWIDKPYFIAQKFTRETNGRKFIFPETYATEGPKNRNYQRLTPDNDVKGQFFFVVGKGDVDFQPNSTNYITYRVGVVFYVNLENIDSARLDDGLFTQSLISEARQLLTSTIHNHPFSYEIIEETREQDECFAEFTFDDKEQYNRAPNQVFRLNIDFKIQEDCYLQQFDYCSSLQNGLTITDHECIIPTVDFSNDELISLLTNEQKVILIEKLNVNNNMEYTIGETLNFQVLRIYNNKGYLMKSNVGFPFTCVDFKNEYESGKWVEASQEIYILSKSDFPNPVAGVITLKANTSYHIIGLIDLNGDRLVGSENTTIFGDSSENSRLTSTGLSIGTALFTTEWTTPMKDLTIQDVDTAIDIDGSGNIVALDWRAMNFVNVPSIGTIKNTENFVFTNGAILNSKGFVFDGTFGTIAFSDSFIQGDGNVGDIIKLLSTAIISRRFRVNDSSIVAFGNTIGINVDPLASIPIESYILRNVNFSGAGTYVSGTLFSDNKSSFKECQGIQNTDEISQLYMTSNIITTPIVTQSTPVKVSGNMISSLITQRFLNTNNRSKYIGAPKRLFKVLSTLSLQSGNNNQIGCFIYKNGIKLDESKINVTTNGTGKAENVNIQSIVELSLNDYIEIFVENTTSTADVLVTDMNTTIN